MWQVEVPQMSARRDSNASSVIVSLSRDAPIIPRAPAWASIIEVAIGVPSRRLSSAAARAESPPVTGLPMGRISVPRREKFSRAKSPRPMDLKYSLSHFCSWPRYVHLQTVEQREREVSPRGGEGGCGGGLRSHGVAGAG